MTLERKTVGAALAEAITLLKRHLIGDPQRDARLLLQHALGIDAASLFGADPDTLSDDALATFQRLIARRATREPVHRIIGQREFYGLSLGLSADTLEPRPDTEVLVDVVLEQVRLKGWTERYLRIVDLGTGTGAILLALLDQLPNASGVATDISPGALEQALQNAEALGLANRVIPLQGSWFEPIDGRFDIIVSNPPYITSTVLQSLEPEVRNHDPERALDGGPDGLNAYRDILRDMSSFLNDGGFAALEIGYDQAQHVSELGQQSGMMVKQVVKDLGQRDRAVLFSF